MPRVCLNRDFYKIYKIRKILSAVCSVNIRETHNIRLHMSVYGSCRDAARLVSPLGNVKYTPSQQPYNLV